MRVTEECHLNGNANHKHTITMKEANRVLTQDSVEIKPSASDIARFWSKVDKSGGDDACWEWKNGKDNDGYGKFWFIDYSIPSHRFSWFLANGKIPKDQPFICHTCDNPKCVNPAHLFAGDSDDNILDMMFKGRTLLGERNSATTLKKEDVFQIRSLYASGGTTSRRLAKQFGVAKSTILRIIHGKTWAHLQHHSQL